MVYTYKYLFTEREGGCFPFFQNHCIFHFFIQFLMIFKVFCRSFAIFGIFLSFKKVLQFFSKVFLIFLFFFQNCSFLIFILKFFMILPFFSELFHFYIFFHFKKSFHSWGCRFQNQSGNMSIVFQARISR